MKRESLNSQLYDDSVLKNIIDIYSESSNFSEDIKKINKRKDAITNVDNLNDKNLFYTRIFFLWKLALNKIYSRDSLTVNDKISFLKFYSYIDSYKVETADDIIKFLDSDNVIDEDLKDFLLKYKWFFENDECVEFNLSDIMCGTVKKEDREHVLMLNIDSDYIYKFFDSFVNECFKKQKTFDFKLNDSSNYDDSCVIYASDNNLDDMINMIKVVLNKNPDILNHINKPSVISSLITDYIGYSSFKDYNKDLNNIIFKEIDHTTRNWIRDNKNTRVNVYESSVMSYKNYFLGLIYLYKINELRNIIDCNKNNSNYSYIEEYEIDSLEFQDAFINAFDLNEEKIIRAVIYNEDISIDIRIGNNIININKNDIDLIVRHQASILYMFDDDYKYQLLNNINSSSNNYDNNNYFSNDILKKINYSTKIEKNRS